MPGIRPDSLAAAPAAQSARAIHRAPSCPAGTASARTRSGQALPRAHRRRLSHRGVTPSPLALDQHLLDFGNGAGGVQVLGAHIRAVHDGMAAIETERVFQLIEPLAAGFITAVDNPAVGSQERRGAEEALAVPPVAWAGGRAACAQNASCRAIDLLLVL